jgi:hypothetical protein
LAPLSYQWYNTLTNAIPGATSNTLVLTNVHAAADGSYTVVVTNSYNAATNSGMVTVVDIPTIITNNFTNFSLTANAQCQALMPNVTGTNYIVVGAACSGSYTVTQTPTNNALLALGANQAVITVTSGYSNAVSFTNTITVVDTTAPAILSCVPAQFVTNGNPGCQATLPDFTGLLVATDNCTASSNLNVVQLPAPGTVLSIGATTVYFYVDDGHGNTNNCPATVTIVDGVAPTFVTQPLSQTNSVGSNVTFTVSATACTALSYQWYYNTNTALLHQTNASLSFTAATTNAGSYSVAVISAGGTNLSQQAVLTVVGGQTQAPVLVSGKLLSNKTFQLTINGASNQTYRVLGSTNITIHLTNWVALTTNTFSGVQTNYTDTAATNYGARYYRVVSP